MRRRASAFGPCVLALGALLTGCAEPDHPSLPEGPQTVSGTVVPMAISLVRRGTHILRQDGADAYTLESHEVDLSDYANRSATLEGILERNTDPSDLPVLVVTSVLSAEEETRGWDVPGLGFQSEIPRTWTVREEPGRAEVYREGSPSPVVRVARDPAGSFPAEGELLLIAQRKAIRFVDPLTGAQTVTIDMPQGTLAFAFVPPEGGQAEAARQEWLAFLRTIALTASASSSARGTPARGTGSVSAPCGGAAGILCPAGSYCDIVDTETNVGRCRAIGA